MGLSNYKSGDSVWVDSPAGAFEGNVSRRASSRSGFVRVDPLDPDIIPGAWPEALVSSRRPNVQDEIEIDDEVVDSFGNPGVVEWIDSGLTERYILIRYPSGGTHKFAERGVSKSNPVQSPSHYNLPGGIQVIDLIRGESFLRGNLIKYVFRAPHKGNELEDMKKASEYLKWEIERLENE